MNTPLAEGTRVRVISQLTSGSRAPIGALGTVRWYDPDYRDYAIEMDAPFQGGHNCDGGDGVGPRAKEGHGQWIGELDLAVLNNQEANAVSADSLSADSLSADSLSADSLSADSLSAGDTKPTNPKDDIGSDKLPLSLVPGTLKAWAALGYLEGVLKYGLVNWRACGVRVSVYLDAMERHYEKFKNGEWEDPVTKVPHLASIVACCGIILDAKLCGKLTDDRPLQAPVGRLIDELGEHVKHLKVLFKDRAPHHYTHVQAQEE